MKEKILSEFADFLSERPSIDGILAFNCKKNALLKVAKALRDEFQFQSLTDLAGVDMGVDAGDARFGVVYHFYSHTKKCYARIFAACESAQEPTLPSLCSVYKGADWLEREAFDLMGIVFEGHPSLRRILMWDTYPYHPLRKDFPLAGKEAPLPPTFEGNEDATEVVSADEAGGPFHAPNFGTQFVSEKEPRSAEGGMSEKIDNI